MRRLSTVLVPALAGGLVADDARRRPQRRAASCPDRCSASTSRRIAAGAPAHAGPRRRDPAVGLRGHVAGPRAVADDRLQLGSARRGRRATRRRWAPARSCTRWASTPRWAASPTRTRKLALYGPGSNSHPRRNKFYTDYLTALVTRYRPSPGSPPSRSGTRPTSGLLPGHARADGRADQGRPRPVDPSARAKLVAASTTVRAKGPVGKFGKAYGAAMKQGRAWPSVDVVSAHFYPPAKEGPADARRLHQDDQEVLQEVRRRQEAAVGHRDELRRHPRAT